MNKIKELREYANLSQSQLASKIGVNQTAISQWERGATMPKLPQVKKLCDFFDVSDAYLLGESNIKKAPPIEDADLTPEEMELIKRFRASPEALQEAAFRLLKEDLKQGR